MKKKDIFPNKPKCEVCKKEIATSFSVLADDRWIFASQCVADEEKYYVEFERFFSSPASTVDWMAHLQEKRWFDTGSWFQMMRRFRAATKSYFQI